MAYILKQLFCSYSIIEMQSTIFQYFNLHIKCLDRTLVY